MKDKYEAAILGGVGAVSGAWKYYVKPELSAKRAWLGLGLLISAYELACPQGETLSEGIDVALERRRSLTIAAIGITSLHLLNVLPKQADPFNIGLRLIKG